MTHALDVADYIVSVANNNELFLSNRKLQYILYVLQSIFLSQKGRELFSQQIEAWDMGPVCPAVYAEYKAYGSSSIPYTYPATMQDIPQQDRNILDSGLLMALLNMSVENLKDMCRSMPSYRNTYVPKRQRIITKESLSAACA